MWSPRWPENLVGQLVVEAEEEAEAHGGSLPDVVELELERCWYINLWTGSWTDATIDKLCSKIGFYGQYANTTAAT